MSLKQNRFARIGGALLLTTGWLIAATAAADEHRWHERGYGERGGEDYAEVLDVDPLYSEVRVSSPYQECRDEQPHRPAYGRYAERPAGGGMILGGLIGAVIGHQLGLGHERAGTTIAGAVIGTAIGHDAALDADRREAYEPRCVTRYDEHYERQINGYRVTYRYNGRLYTSQLPYDPGERIPVHVTVEPERGGG